jgi:hypothetical protein
VTGTKLIGTHGADRRIDRYCCNDGARITVTRHRQGGGMDKKEYGLRQSEPARPVLYHGRLT